MADFVYGTWIALFVPAKTPSEVVARLNKAMSAVVKDPELQAYVKDSGMDIAAESSVPDLARFYTTETKLYQGLARQIGVTAE